MAVAEYRLPHREAGRPSTLAASKAMLSHHDHHKEGPF